MTTPTPNPHGLPSRCKALDIHWTQGTPAHWSFNESLRTRAKRSAATPLDKALALFAQMQAAGAPAGRPVA